MIEKNLVNDSKGCKQIYAIVRIDEFISIEVDLSDRITIKKIVLTEEIACREVERLNNINKSKGCLYFWQITRISLDDCFEIQERL